MGLSQIKAFSLLHSKGLCALTATSKVSEIATFLRVVEVERRQDCSVGGKGKKASNRERVAYCQNSLQVLPTGPERPSSYSHPDPAPSQMAKSFWEKTLSLTTRRKHRQS